MMTGSPALTGVLVTDNGVIRQLVKKEMYGRVAAECSFLGKDGVKDTVDGLALRCKENTLA